MSKSKEIHKKKRVFIENPIKQVNGVAIERICTSCYVFKSLDNFFKNKKRLAGVYPVCKECCSIDSKQRYNNNKDSYSKKQRRYYLNNQEKIKLKTKLYSNQNRSKLNSYFYARDRDKRQRALTKIFLKEMRELYKQAKNQGLTLDHIIPLKNKDVCGLHVPWNVQFLKFEENASKNNKFDGTYENESWRKICD
jgi:hypothetical protein